MNAELDNKGNNLEIDKDKAEINPKIEETIEENTSLVEEKIDNSETEKPVVKIEEKPTEVAEKETKLVDKAIEEDKVSEIIPEEKEETIVESTSLVEEKIDNSETMKPVVEVVEKVTEVVEKETEVIDKAKEEEVVSEIVLEEKEETIVESTSTVEEKIDNSETEQAVVELEEKSAEVVEKETEVIDKAKEEEVVSEIVPEENEETAEDYSILTKEEILEKLKTLIHETEIDKSRKNIELLKSHYYKAQKAENEKLKAELLKNAEEGVDIEMPKDPTEDYLKELMADFKKKKAEFAASQEQEKGKNLKLKNDIIEKIKGLANSEESLNKTFIEFKELQKEWLIIGPVPSSEATTLWKNYQLQIERFYDLVRINKELRDLDFKKNLEQKIEICEKAESLLLEPDAVTAYKNLQEFHNLWKELGPVPADKREEIWDRFSDTSKKIRQAYQGYFEKQKEERNANYEQKIILCEKAEAVANADVPTNSKAWGTQTDQVLELQKIWKTIGMVPKEVNAEVYERFRAACNRFFNSKKEFYETINEELNINYQKKLELCVSAESLQDSKEWRKTTETFFDLQKKWKEIGPAPKKHSDQIWKRFRSACDKFFNSKSSFYSNIDKEHKENLIKKETLIAEVKAFKPSEKQTDNINSIKTFQTRWTEIGYVSNNQKDRLYGEYRSAVNDIYENLNLSKDTLDMSNFNSKVEILKETGEIDSLKKERSNILKRIQDLNLEINQYENNMGFFSSGSDSILKDFEKKINKTKAEITNLKEKKKSIDLAEREIKKKESESKNEQND